MKIKKIIMISFIIIFHSYICGKNIIKDDILKKKLTELQYDVTHNCGTEPPFDNKYWNNKEEGIYVDIISGDVLFCSTHKYDSGSGWPSFYQAIEDPLIFDEDHELGYKRTEVKSKTSNSHLGHVFEDGPNPTGLRYCINSASLKFISKKDMAKEGYKKYLYLFIQK